MCFLKYISYIEQLNNTNSTYNLGKTSLQQKKIQSHMLWFFSKLCSILVPVAVIVANVSSKSVSTSPCLPDAIRPQVNHDDGNAHHDRGFKILGRKYADKDTISKRLARFFFLLNPLISLCFDSSALRVSTQHFGSHYFVVELTS